MGTPPPGRRQEAGRPGPSGHLRPLHTRRLQWGQQEHLLVEGHSPSASRLLTQKREQCVAQGTQSSQSTCFPASPELGESRWGRWREFECSCRHSGGLRCGQPLRLVSPERPGLRVWDFLRADAQGLGRASCAGSTSARAGFWATQEMTESGRHAMATRAIGTLLALTSLGRGGQAEALNRGLNFNTEARGSPTRDGCFWVFPDARPGIWVCVTHISRVNSGAPQEAAVKSCYQC